MEDWQGFQNCEDGSIESAAWARNFALVSGIVAGALGVVGNAVTIAALVRVKQLRSQPITLLVLNLAVTDLVYCLVALPSHDMYLAIRDADWWKQNLEFCSLSAYWRYANSNVDFTSVGAIAVERYVKLVYPFKYRHLFTVRRTYVIIALIWIIRIALYIPTAASVPGFGYFGFDSEHNRCDIMEGEVVRMVVHNSTMFIIWIFMIFCYTRIFLYIRQSKRNLTRHSCYISQHLHNREMAFVVASFEVCCLYTFTVVALSLYEVVDVCTKHVNTRLIVFSIYYHTYYANNLIYAVRVKVYRRAYKQLMWKLLHRSYIPMPTSYIPMTTQRRGRSKSLFTPRMQSLPSVEECVPVLARERRLSTSCPTLSSVTLEEEGHSQVRRTSSQPVMHCHPLKLDEKLQ